MKSASVANDEIAKFSAYAEDWWNLQGAFRPLHRLNPVRLRYIRERVLSHKPLIEKRPMAGLKVLDVGCGGGILTEPLTRQGAKVTGIDASSEAIQVAKKHARDFGLQIDYRCVSVEKLAQSREQYDLVVAMEIVEHVADIDSFLQALSLVLRPGGILILSTLNRTLKSFALGIVAAEYILKWAPQGTHQWNKFVKPSELVFKCEKVGLPALDLTGVVYDITKGTFMMSRENVDVNYMLTVEKSV